MYCACLPGYDIVARLVVMLGFMGVTVQFYTESVGDFSGWFDGKTVYVDIRQPYSDWLATLVHEFQHVKQSQIKTVSWKQAHNVGYLASRFAGFSAYAAFERIYYGNLARCKRETKRKITSALLEHERECEILTLEFLRKNDTKRIVDLQQYETRAVNTLLAYAETYCKNTPTEITDLELSAEVHLHMDFLGYAEKPKKQKQYTCKQQKIHL